MSIGVYFSISVFFVISILSYIFFKKEKVENAENKDKTVVKKQNKICLGIQHILTSG